MQFERVAPESLGIPARAVEAMLDQWYRDGIEMHSFALLRHGKIAAEGYWKPYAPGVPHIMFSFSKSLTSTAVGFAVQEGLLSLDQRLIDIFPDQAPAAPGENLAACTVRHLLMMGCGQETEVQWVEGSDLDWIAQFLHHDFPHKPGSHFLYNTVGANLLSAIVAKKTGQTLTAYLRPRLFEPLGMRDDIACYALPDGTEAGGYGYSLALDDMARFMQFVANRGSWQGRQLLAESWFDQATKKQIENRGAGWGGDPDWQQGYCFQFWRCEPEGVFRGDGAYGQYGIVMSKQDAVLVIQSASLRLQAVLTAVWERLLPAMNNGPLPEDPAADAHLSERLEHLELVPFFGMRNPGGEQSLDGAVYLPDDPGAPSLTDYVGGIGHFVPDGKGLGCLGFRFHGDDAALLADGVSIRVGMNGHFVTTDLDGSTYGACGHWRAKNQLEIQLRCTRYASGRRLIFRFEGDKLFLTGDSTIPEEGGLGDPAAPPLSFTLAGGDVRTKTKMYWEV